MRLVVLDTNIIVSAGIKPGNAPAKLVMDWVLEGQIQLVTSPWVVNEYREVVRRPKFRRYGFPPDWFELGWNSSLRRACAFQTLQLRPSEDRIQSICPFSLWPTWQELGS
jgi:predicted nucleic acid-binding protein